MLPVMISDPELREKAAATFMSEEFNNNIEQYFVENIKVSAWSPSGMYLGLVANICVVT
jgi:hypothetical protein